MKLCILGILILFLPAGIIRAQDNLPRQFVQVDGLVLDEEGLPVRYVNIVSRLLRTGSETDIAGIFSIISTPGDTLTFTSIGYKPAAIILPGTIEGPKFTVDLLMEVDTINIGPVLVLPWKTYEDFKRAVVEYTPPEAQLIENMEKNLALIEQQIYGSDAVSPEAGYKMAMARETERIITRNQTPINNLFNPFAWAKFIEGIKNGLLRNKSRKKDSRKKNDRKEDSSEKKSN